jgi:ABC-2 type transport system permease protein
MRNVLTIIGKEIRSYFVSPVAYVVLTGFLLLGGWFFFNLLSRFNLLLSLYTQFQGGDGAANQLNLNDFVIAPLMNNLSIILVILVPMITMRAFAEEKKNGTYELLLTSPLRTGEIVLGKFLASFLFICIMIGLTAIYPLLLWWFGNPEVGVMISGYLGLLMMATAFVALGLFTSSVTENQIIAAVSGLVAMLLLYIIGWPAQGAGDILGPILKYLSVTDHFAELVKGVIDTRALVYFASLIGLALFLTMRSVESLRWR